MTTKYRMKKGMGPHYIHGKCIEPGMTLECEPYEIGGARDKFEALTPEPGPEVFAPSVGLKAKHMGSGKWKVINQATGEPIHDGYLTKEDANAMATAPDNDADAGGGEDAAGDYEPAAVGQEPDSDGTTTENETEA